MQNLKNYLAMGGSFGTLFFGVGLIYKYGIFTGKNATCYVPSVDSGHRAIKFSKYFGVLDRVYREGWHLMLPWFERPIIYDVMSHPQVISSQTGTRGTLLL